MATAVYNSKIMKVLADTWRSKHYPLSFKFWMSSTLHRFKLETGYELYDLEEEEELEIALKRIREYY